MTILFREPSDIDMPCVTELLTALHIPEVAGIEQVCFSEPWSERSLSLLLEGENFGVVAICEGRVAAYGGMTCVLDEGAVTNIATLPEYRQRGIGRAVLKTILDEAEKRGIISVFLEVRASNEAARALYLSEGFEECGVRKNFYRHPNEDAIQMAYRKKI